MLVHQWEFQDPKMEIPTIYTGDVRGYTPKHMALYGTWYLHFRILEFPVIQGWGFCFYHQSNDLLEINPQSGDV